MQQSNNGLVGVVFYDMPAGRQPDEIVSYSFLTEATLADEARSRIVVPDPNWKRLDPHSVERLGGFRLAPTPRVGFFRLEEGMARSLRDKLDQLRASDPGTLDRQRAIELVSVHLRGYIQWRFPIDPALKEHGVWSDAPGLDTVTYNRATNLRLGMHIDSWDGSSVTDRQRARTRFCVNLGPDVRHFLWVPHTVDRIVSVIEGKEEVEDTVKVKTEHLSAYVRKQADVPVFRLELLPLEGYICDTDNLFHDGSSLEAKQLNFHYTLRSAAAEEKGPQGLGPTVAELASATAQAPG